VGVIAPQSFRTATGNDGERYVRIRPATRVADTRLINLLYPTTTARWNTRPSFSLVEDTGDAVAIRVTLNDGSGRKDDILLTYTNPQATVVGSYFYDGQIAVVSRSANNSLQRIFMYGGTRLNFPATQGPNTVLVSNLEPAEAFEAQFAGQTVLVYGNIKTRVRLYAPTSTTLRVNGQVQSFTREGNYILFGPVN
jgi:hypothetical protein